MRNDDREAIGAAANALAETLRESALYREYRKSRICLEEKPELARRLLEYKQKQAAFEMKRLLGQTVSFDEEKYISHLYAELSLNAEASTFFAREDAFLEVYRQVLDMLGGACEIDTFGT